MVSLIIAHGGLSPKLTAVAVSDLGDLRQHKIFSYLCLPFAEKYHNENYEVDVEKMRIFIMENNTALVVVAANCPDARILKKTLTEKIVNDEAVVSRLGHEPYVTYGYLDVPVIAANSPSYNCHKSLPPIVKQGLSLARFKQSPVNESLKFWNDDEGENMPIFSLNLHQFQKVVPQDKLVEALRNVIVSSVNSIGVDLHATVNNENLHPSMQFISGLGPIKSSDFIKKFLVSETPVSFRIENTFLSEHVHYNAVGFINAAKAAKGTRMSQKCKVLDSTRIHPEFYSVATKMARSALDETHDPSDAVAEIIRDPSKLRQLDLDQFSQKCESLFGKDYKSIFYFIRDELETPFRDVRGEYSEYESKMINNGSNLFYMLTGESPYSFFEGMVLPVSITKIIQEIGYGCKSLGKSTWSGFVHNDSITDPKIQELNVGMVCSGKVLKIEYENISVKLSIPARDEYITEKEVLDRILPTYRAHFNVNLEEDSSFSGSQDSIDRFGPGNKYTRRTNLSSYSHFKNITYGE